MTQVVVIFIMDDNNLPILHSQYHGGWWPGDTWSQGIGSHGIGLVCLEYSRWCSLLMCNDTLQDLIIVLFGHCSSKNVFVNIYNQLNIKNHQYQQLRTLVPEAGISDRDK